MSRARCPLENWIGKSRRITRRAALIALSVLLLWNLCSCAGKAESAGASGTESSVVTEPGDVVEFNGVNYRIREDLQTILVMGLDKFERPETAIGYTNQLQADLLLLLVIDEASGACNVLQLNRDTMTEIRRLGIGGAGAGTFTGQLALAHTYGSGGSDSSLNAVRAVSTLLGGVSIDHYLTITMDAVGKINDAVGGVTLTLMDDFSAMDPSMGKGQEVTLKGEQALLYVCSRSELDDTTNLHRMERQQQYMGAFYAKFEECSRQDTDFLTDMLMEINDDFVSDCSIRQLSELGNFLAECTIYPIRTIKGQTVLGDEFLEFHIDRDSLRETIFDLFYETVSDG